MDTGTQLRRFPYSARFTDPHDTLTIGVYQGDPCLSVSGITADGIRSAHLSFVEDVAAKLVVAYPRATVEVVAHPDNSDMSVLVCGTDSPRRSLSSGEVSTELYFRAVDKIEARVRAIVQDVWERGEWSAAARLCHAEAAS